MEIEKTWQRIEEIFHAALDLEGDDRKNYLLRTCEDDQILLEEVKSLVAAHEDGNREFLSEPAFNEGLKILHGNAQENLTGQTVGVYQIKQKLGEGGMGSVYLATDLRLNRLVALKFLTGFSADDQAAKKQIIKEARAAANIARPNVCIVYGIEEIDRHRFIVMQYAEGETLSSLINRRAIAAEEILPLAKQIAEAVATAHAYGIIHRDIKPANIMVGTAGQIKVLDFGLAKTIVETSAAAGESAAVKSDLSSGVSHNSSIIGTVSYMSPEQLGGARLDYTSDIFSFGIVLYELVTGRHPFARHNSAETIAQILSEVPVPPLNLETNYLGIRNLEHLILKCLEKDPARRYQSMSEILLDLDATVGRKRWRFLPANPADWVFVVFLIMLSTVAALYYFRANKIEKIAVLPIVNTSSDSNFDYAGAGLTENLIKRLAGVSKIQVKPYAAVVSINLDSRNYPEIGGQLRVDKILTGAIIKREAGVYLQNRLINVSDGAQLWSDETPLSDGDFLTTEEQLTQKVISEIELLENDSFRKNNVQRFTRNQAAFEYYLRGRHYWEKRNKENIAKAIESYSNAVDLDPTDAQSYAALASAYVLQSGVAYGSVSTKEVMPKAKYAAKRALEIDGTLAESHGALAIVLGKYEWNWAEAEVEFKRAIEINDEYSEAHYWYSEFLSTAGRTSEALEEAEKARELAPFSPQMEMNVGRVLYLGRRYDEALEYLQQAVEKNPANTKAKYLIGLAYVQKGMYPAALQIFEQLYASSEKDLTAAVLGYTLAKLNRKKEALKILTEMNTSDGEKKVPPQEKAIILIGLEEKAAALKWLEQAFDEHLSTLSSLRAEPLFDSLREEPKFSALLRQMNLN